MILNPDVWKPLIDKVEDNTGRSGYSYLLPPVSENYGRSGFSYNTAPCVTGKKNPEEYLTTAEISECHVVFEADKVECMIKNIARLRGWRDPSWVKPAKKQIHVDLFETDYIFL